MKRIGIIAALVAALLVPAQSRAEDVFDERTLA